MTYFNSVSKQLSGGNLRNHETGVVTGILQMEIRKRNNRIRNKSAKNFTTTFGFPNIASGFI